ncbi:hypothetical protein CYLTODRAFT_418088 [Cylindrobasidium torrendii FP15055 ss-10]|uniref:Uncharacterized protein n=1 Tax=Cylindrobasidium torrendii FP15055 ss-10 TaxID=1314674 RepID=A0A0D7BQ13_9AGAR|nr:hypothetical protein CYLTODRAFT_418088 [Cylindrobasidium torrendii FP15055 ss-10]
MDCSSPAPNPDISGIGVRVSFYLQYVLAVLCCSASRQARDIEDALLTLSITNMAYCVTTLILAYKMPAELTLYDALVVIYLTAFTLGYTFVITILYVRMEDFHYHAYVIVILQSYLVLCTFLVVLITLPTFGSDAECNYDRRASVMLVSVPIAGFRIAGFVVCAFSLTMGTFAILYHNFVRSDLFRSTSHFITKSPTIDKTIITHLVMNTVTFTLCIAHVETLRLYNHPQSDDQSWGFGQVLPVFLIALPAGRTITLFARRAVTPLQPPPGCETTSLCGHTVMAISSVALVPAILEAHCDLTSDNVSTNTQGSEAQKTWFPNERTWKKWRGIDG